jgi:mRNA (guanine-N7-)-methyltransferase
LVFVNSVPHNVLELYVGYNPANWEKITAMRFLQGLVSKKREYTKREFKPDDVVYEGISECYIPKDFKTKEGDEIEDDSVVEFKYDNTDDQPPYQTKWAPIRIRKDKNEMYRQTRALSGAANDYGTAMNIWRSIRVPVTQDHITGVIKIDKLPEEDNVYYVRKIDRDKFASKGMLDFHNIVKRKLIEGTKATSLVDMACGKGGDLNKFVNSRIERVLGFDYNRDNIENPIDGMYSRLLDKKDPNVMRYRYAFLPMDLSERINLESIQNLDDKHVAGVLYGNTKDSKLSRYYGMAAEKFDVVNCQFAVHYFFESERKLDAFLYNVDMHMKEGGQFIGTCLDGHAVKKILANEKQVSGEKDGRTLWSIKKLYEKNLGVNYGEKIEVFMESIGRVMNEYLVNLDLLHKKLKSLGYEKVECKGFKEYYDDNTAMDDVQKRYSEMNTTFVFKKLQASAPRKTFKKKTVAIGGSPLSEESI